MHQAIFSLFKMSQNSLHPIYPIICQLLCELSIIMFVVEIKRKNQRVKYLAQSYCLLVSYCLQDFNLAGYIIKYLISFSLTFLPDFKNHITKLALILKQPHEDLAEALNIHEAPYNRSMFGPEYTQYLLEVRPLILKMSHLRPGEVKMPCYTPSKSQRWVRNLSYIFRNTDCSLKCST